MNKYATKIVALGMLAPSLLTSTAFAATPDATTNEVPNVGASANDGIQPYYIWTDQYKCNGDYVNVREGPGTDYASFDYLMKGDIVGVHRFKTNDKGEKWANVDLGNWVSGWVLAKYLDYFAPHP